MPASSSFFLQVVDEAVEQEQEQGLRGDQSISTSASGEFSMTHHDLSTVRRQLCAFRFHLLA